MFGLKKKPVTSSPRDFHTGIVALAQGPQQV